MATDITLYKEKDCLFLKRVKSKEEIGEDYSGVLIDTNGNEKETRKIVDSLKGKQKVIAVYGHNNNFNRRVIETMKVDYLISPEKVDKRDNLKQRDSGTNHVTARLAKKNNISLVFDITELKTLASREKSIRFSRIIQNIKICRKSGCAIKIASFAKSKNNIKSKEERQNLLLTLGASTQQTKESTRF